MKSKMFFLISLFLISLSFSLSAQPIIKASAYTDMYYCTDNDNSASIDNDNYSLRKFAPVNHQKDRFGINFAQLSLNALADNYRANVTLQYGDLAEYSWESKMKYLQQANIGVCLIGSLWLDGGLMPSHFGTENLLPKDNFLSSYSMTNFFEPLYNMGAKLSYTFNNDLHLAFYVINGIYQYTDINENKTLSTEIKYAPKGKDYSVSYVFASGNDIDIEKNTLLTMHNFNISANPTNKLELKAQLNYNQREKAVVVNPITQKFKNGTFILSNFQARYSFNEKISASCRLSYFDDSDGVFYTKLSGLGFNLGMQYQPTSNSYIRLECGYLSLDEGENQQGMIFYRDNDFESTRSEISINYGLYFDLMK